MAFLMSTSFLLQTLPDFGETMIDIVFDREIIERGTAEKAYQNIFKEWDDLADRLFRKKPHWEDDVPDLPPG